MKNFKILFGSILVVASLFLSGCYTQVAMTDNGNGNSGYGYDNSQGNYQTPADSNYGNQYDQYGNQNYYDSTQGNADNYGNNYPPSYYGPWNDNYWSPGYSLGFYWGTPFYNPYSWDPFGLWSYYPGYYPYYSSFYPTYYPYYNGYYGYYGGYYGSGNTAIIARTHDTYRLRNNNGFRNNGDRGGSTRTNGNILTSSPSTYGVRTEPSARTMNKPSSTRNEPTAVYGRNNNGRQTTGRAYNPRPGYARNNSGYYNSNNSRVQNRNNNSRRSEPRTYAPARRSYSPPPRTYSPPQRSYSPPPSSNSAPRSYSPPPARSSGGGSSSGRSSSSGGNRGR